MKPTEFDLARMNFYLDKPELIVGFGEWEKEYLCACCQGNLDPDSYALKNLSPSLASKVSVEEISCPHCFAHGVPAKCWYDTNFIETSTRLTFDLVRRRKVWLEYPKKKLFGKGTEGDWFWEYAPIQRHESNGPTKEVKKPSK